MSKKEIIEKMRRDDKIIHKFFIDKGFMDGQDNTILYLFSMVGNVMQINTV